MMTPGSTIDGPMAGQWPMLWNTIRYEMDQFMRCVVWSSSVLLFCLISRVVDVEFLFKVMESIQSRPLLFYYYYFKTGIIWVKGESSASAWLCIQVANVITSVPRRVQGDDADAKRRRANSAFNLSFVEYQLHLVVQFLITSSAHSAQLFRSE